MSLWPRRLPMRQGSGSSIGGFTPYSDRGTELLRLHHPPQRFSVQRKMAIVARLLRGEPLELVARETNISIARLTEWRRAIAGAASGTRSSKTRYRRAIHRFTTSFTVGSC